MPFVPFVKSIAERVGSIVKLNLTTPFGLIGMLIGMLIASASGCFGTGRYWTPDRGPVFADAEMGPVVRHEEGVAGSPKSPSPADSTASPAIEADYWTAPRLVAEGLPTEFNDLSLDDAISIALQDSRVLRDLNARVLISPESTETSLDPAIVHSNPVNGTEAALAAFDARVDSSLVYANNDEVFNNLFLGSGATEVQQDLTTWDWQVSRTVANGANLSLSTQVLHDNNNGVSNLFQHSWRTVAEATVRQPLGQGYGVAFNQIAGPAARPGMLFTSGLVISRIDYEVSQAEFEQAVRDYVLDITDAYWDLYFAYHNFRSARSARDVAYDTWMNVKSRYENDLPGGEADAEAEARAQFYEFQQLLNRALAADSPTAPGVLQAEANLRRLLGLPQTGREFLRPIDTPVEARIVYDWDDLIGQALARRAELRQQRNVVRQRELEWIASRNFLKPRFDAIATYRNTGFGDDLTGGGGGRFSSALKDAVNFEHDEWEFGLEYNVPLGRRRARSGVRFAELNLHRARAVLEEQNEQVVHDLGTAWRQLEQSYNNLDFARKRYEAARQTVEARTAAYQEELSNLVDLLDAQRRLRDAEANWFRAKADYSRANFDLLRESGQLLDGLSIAIASDGRNGPALPIKIDQQPLDYRLTE